MIEACELHEEINNFSLLQELIAKIPPSLQLSWGTRKTKLINTSKKANLSEFCDWIYDIGVSASSINFYSQYVPNAPTEYSRNRQKNAYIHTHTEQQSEKNCLICDNCKSVSLCPKFLQLTETKGGTLSEDTTCANCVYVNIMGFAKAISNVIKSTVK